MITKDAGDYSTCAIGVFLSTSGLCCHVNPGILDDQTNNERGAGVSVRERYWPPPYVYTKGGHHKIRI